MKACGWLSQPLSTMPDKTPQRHIAALRRPTCFVVYPRQERNGASRVLRRISFCMPRPDDSDGPSHSRHYRMLLCCLRCTLKPSASATVISKLYQHFRVRDHPYGLQNSLPTLRPSCSQHISMQLRHGPKARYGWVANPYRKPFLAFSRQGLSPCKIRRALLGAITGS